MNRPAAPSEEPLALDDDEGNRSFSLFTASIGSLVPNANDPTLSMTMIQTAQGLRDNHALRRLQKLQNRNKAATSAEGGKQYDTFILRGPYNFAASTEDDDVWYQLLVLSATVASAIVEVFTEEAKEQNQGQWQQLQIWDCHVNDALMQVLQAAKRWGLFSSWKFRNCSPLATHPILSSIALGNPSMTHLCLDRVILDLPVARFLQSILDTRSSNITTTDNATSRTRLLHLELRETVTIQSDEVIPMFAQGLKENDSLVELTLIALSKHQAVSTTLVDSLLGHCALQTLNLSRNCFSESTIMALGRILHNPSCRISSLHLDNCELLTPSGYLGPLRAEVVAKALGQGRCESLEKLSLQENCVSSRDLQTLLRTVYFNCPNLLELNLFHNRIERILWSQTKLADAEEELLAEQTTMVVESEPSSDSPETPTNPSTTTTTTIPTTIPKNRPPLQALWLTRNPVLHNRFRARTCSENANLERLLVDFPALGQIVHQGQTNARYMKFSERIHALLPFQYTTRGHLEEGKLPLSLWTRVFDRVPRGIAATQMLWNGGKDDPGSDRLYSWSCQASVLFQLLRHHPSLITRDTCQLYSGEDTKQGAESESTLPFCRDLAALLAFKARAQREAAQTKRRKLR